ncbi:MAG: hypothetical protein BWX90_01146 [bacterium ADurb.Bin132]|nr:MAG: hypothetical protein BWX90_01146 [bacterium ADurb.Bin132]
MSFLSPTCVVWSNISAYIPWLSDQKEPPASNFLFIRPFERREKISFERCLASVDLKSFALFDIFTRSTSFDFPPRTAIHFKRVSSSTSRPSIILGINNLVSPIFFVSANFLSLKDHLPPAPTEREPSTRESFTSSLVLNMFPCELSKKYMAICSGKSGDARSDLR